MAGYDVEVSGIEDLLETVDNLSKKWHRIWYRGVSSSQYSLTPSVLRQESLAKRETNRCKAFKRQAASIHPNISENDFPRWLFIAQHYRLPTRLLDWSESLLVALYFALEGELKTRPAIWALDPVALNRLALKDNNALVASSHNPFTLTYCRAAFSTYTPDLEKVPSLPLAIYPEQLDTRMLAQKSCFTIHGSDKSSLEDQLSQLLSSNPNKYLVRILFAKSPVPKLYRQFRFLTPGASVMFPGLDGIVKELLYDD